MDGLNQKMNDIFYHKAFIRLLKKEKCYYKYNLNNSFQNLSNFNPRQFLSSSFIWRETNEGHVFWQNINSKWLNIVRIIDEKYAYQTKTYQTII